MVLHWDIKIRSSIILATVELNNLRSKLQYGQTMDDSVYRLNFDPGKKKKNQSQQPEKAQ